MELNLKRVIEIIEEGDWVALKFITANVNNETGGEVLEIPRCRIARKDFNEQVSLDKTASVSVPASPGRKRDPNHNANFTRNIQLPDKSIITIHPALVFNINNQAVI